ncbi:right-handed parallel beta-helix repeat-containing protein [uncultured Methanobrevibacter sp.]|uniref:right-handed parallel beta-helix repeat-containing protein n=1 Tax=uncultured Methanobrevibacter sp. TaxID=253161 RepID=UPI0025FE0F1D|nr:right-handed parallel beta-helix repeat-containing protein [uncultured Methanobrevibacter sp.]
MRKYEVFIMAFVLLFLMAGAVSASEVEDSSDSTMLKDNSYDLNVGNVVSDSDSDVLDSEKSGLSSNDDIQSSENDVLEVANDSQVLETEREYGGNSFSGLQDEINNCHENDTIILKNDIYQEGLNQISISKSLIIDGNGYIIDAQQKSGIFTIRSSNVILRNINFRNAGGETSGAIEIYQSDCVIENCNFENNSGRFNGAAILLGGGSLYVSNSTFKNNSANASKSGGAVYSLADIHMDNCTFIDNSAYAGGAIYSSDCYLTNCIFINNNATTAGGSVYSSKGEISNCTFINGSSNLGAAVLLMSNEGRIESSRFINNSADTGGAIFLTGRVESQSKNITIETCTFEDNYANNLGGAIYSDGENYTVDNSTFKNNSAKNDGGAIYNNYIGFITNCNLSNNSAKNGGALYNNFNVTLINDTFESNNATLGGAIYSNNCNLTSCALISNSATEAGGAIYSTTNISTMYLCNFTGNSANNGGAIYLLNNNCTIDFCDFVNNTAKDGGAIYSIGAAVTMEFLKFISNNASNNGGAFFLDSSNQYVLSYSSFLENGASNEGGAIYCNDSNLTAYSTFFINNSASRAGAMHFINSTALIDFCDFDYNLATGDGGGIIFNDSNSTIIYSTFVFNVAGKKGAAIYCTQSDNSSQCNISSSTFLNNKAESYSLSSNLSNGVLSFLLTGWNNYVNAIYAEYTINISNITYWNGDIVNSDYEIYNNGASGQNITLEIYDSQNNLLTNTTLITNSFGEQYFTIVNFDDGNYTYNAYHLDGDYYTYVNNEGNFTLNRSGSSISLNIEDNAEFDYMNCTIPFDIVNRTEVKVLITSEDESLIYVNGTVDQYSRRIAVNLPINDDYYKITVFNLPSSVYRGSQDSKLFKIKGVGSSISINPIDDVAYGETINVTFDVENRTVIEVYVFDENNESVYRTYTINDTIRLPILPAGQYNLTAINLPDLGISESNASITFNVLKGTNHLNITANDVVYGNWTTIIFSADVDGNYTIDFNGTLTDIEIEDGVEIWNLRLAAGDYYINATFDDANYDTIVTNATFTVSKANNTAVVVVDDIIYGNNVSIQIFAKVKGSYVLDVNGTLVDVRVFNGQGKAILELPAGQYYANAIFDDANYDSIINQCYFHCFRSR